jgi:hypothetical protein
MQATIRLAGGNRLIQVEGETQKDLFEGMAMAYEVFDETCCGLCGSTNIRPVVRIVDKFRFYEYSCQEPGCWGKLTFGQSQDIEGGLFPKRKLLENGKPHKDGEYGPHKGWTKYRGDNHQDEPPATVPKANTESSLPPAPPLTNLRNMLGDMGVTENKGQFRDAIVQFVTKGTDKRITYPQCLKNSEAARWAVSCLEVAKIKLGDDLLVKVQEWMSGSKK